MMRRKHKKTFCARARKTVRTVLAVAASGVLAFSMTACSKDPTISDRRKESVKVLVNMDDCVVDDEATANAAAASLSGEIGDMETNAKKTFYVLKEMGFSNENIAGVLGNWSTESSIDPTGVETIFDEPFQIGEKKKAAMEDPNSFTLNTVFPAYAGRVSINKKAYIGDDGKYYPGIGLAGFTGPATTRLLRYAEKNNLPWYSFDLQLSFSIVDSDEGYGRGSFWKGWAAEATPESAAETFLAKYEGCPGMMLSDRQKHAREWYNKMKDWEANPSYAQAIMNMGNGTASVSNTTATARTASNKPVATSNAGTKIDIPDEFDSKQQNYGYGSGWQILIDGVQCSTGWVEWGKEGNGGKAGEQARRWVKEGRKYAVGKDLVLIDGRVGVVVKEIFGTSGDYVDIVYKDGNVLHGIIIDNQGANDDAGPGGSSVPWAKYGHNVSDGACNVLEWYSDGGKESHLWKEGRNPCSIPGFEYITGTVDYIINTNGVNTGSATDKSTVAASDEACEEVEEEAGMNVSAGEAAAVEESTTARLEWLYGSAGVPKTKAENEQYLETFDVVIRDMDGNKRTWSLTMHKKLKSEVQAMFEDIYANTDYKIDPSDGNSLRDWDAENNRFSGPQPNSNHAYGLAMDINVKHNNGTGSCDVGTTYNPGTDPLSFSADHKVVQIMKKHGFFWGGAWTSVKDPMHFAYTNH